MTVLPLSGEDRAGAREALAPGRRPATGLPPAVAHGPSATYRPDIDGLRALAVILVLLHHFDPRLFPNGYLGVDIFFVISGYVVTLATLARRETGAVRAAASFWLRRILRIYPALLACVLVTLLMAMALMPAFPLVVYNSIMRTGIAATLGVGNLYLLRSQLDYFSAEQTFNPFLHTWSLGVEEQFYLVFSLAFIALPLALARLRPLSSVRAVRIAVMALATLASLALLVRWPSDDPLATYYLLPYRFWELGIGSLLALLLPAAVVRAGSARAEPFLRAGQVAAAGLAVALAVIPLGSGSFSLPALVAGTASAAAIIVFGSVSPKARSPLLTCPAMVRTGLLSYSLYLWHWPVFVAFGLTVGMQSIATAAGALAVVIGAAVLSYRYVEQPFRRHGRLSTRWRLSSLAGLASGVVAVVIVAQVVPGAGYLGSPQRWTTDWLPGPAHAYADDGRVLQSSCDLANGSTIPATIPAVCGSAPGAAATRPTILAVGDSLAFADWGMLGAGVRTGAFALKALSHNGCNVATADDRKVPSCLAYWSALPGIVDTDLRRGDAVLVAVSLTAEDPTAEETATRHLERLIETASEAGVSVIVQAPLPRFGRPAYLCVPEWFRRDFRGCDVSRVEFEAARAPVMRRLAELRARFPDMAIWDPLDILCPDSRCGSFAGSSPLFRDRTHLSHRSSEALGEPFMHFLAATRQGRT